MTTYPPPICMFCTHRRKDDPSVDAWMTCDAFPSGIPEAIMLSSRDHREAYRGDHGVRFEPVDDEAASGAAFLISEARRGERPSIEKMRKRRRR